MAEHNIMHRTNLPKFVKVHWLQQQPMPTTGMPLTMYDDNSVRKDPMKNKARASLRKMFAK